MSSRAAHGRVDAKLQLAVWNAYAFVVLQLANVSTLFSEPTVLSRAILAGVAITVLVGLAFNLLQRRLVIVAASGGIMALLVAQAFVFANVSGYPINWNILFSYTGILSFAVFTPLSGQQLDRVLRMLFVVSLAYCTLYLVLAIGIVRLPGLKVLDDEVRGSRLFLSTAHAAYCLFHGIASLREGKRIALWLLPALLSAAAIALFFSRVFTLLLAIVVVLSLIAGTSRLVRQLLCGFMLTAAGAILLSVVAPDLNPFAALGADPSGAARAAAYEILRGLLTNHWLLGIGLASEVKDFSVFVGQQYVFWEDVGPLGVWATFGLAGLIGFLGLAMFCILGVRRPAEMDEARFATLSWSGILAGLTAIHSPDLLGGSAAPIVGLMIALALRMPDHAQAPVQHQRSTLPVPLRRRTPAVASSVKALTRD